jgi:hypothetical protein
MNLAYDRAHFDDDEVAVITSGWAPFRTWVSLLLSVNLEDSTRTQPSTGRPLSHLIAGTIGIGTISADSSINVAHRTPLMRAGGTSDYFLAIER